MTVAIVALVSGAVARFWHLDLPIAFPLTLRLLQPRPWSKAGNPISGPPWAKGPTPIRIGEYWNIYYDRYRDHALGSVAFEEYGWMARRLGQGARHGTAFRAPKAIVDRLRQTRLKPSRQSGDSRSWRENSQPGRVSL